MAAAEAVGPAVRPAEGLNLDPRAAAAIVRYADAVDAAPDDVAARRELALLLQANGVDEGAIDAWSQVIAMTPADGTAWYQRARIRQATGDSRNAMADIDRAVELAPDEPAIITRRGIWRRDAGELEAAEADFRRAGELAPRFRPAREGMASVWVQTDRHALALRDILVPLRDAGEATPYTRFLIGQSLRLMNRMDEAEIELQAGSGSSLEFGGADPFVAEVSRYWMGERADLTRARAMIRGGLHDQAITLLEPLLTDPSEDAAARVLLGEALRRRGDLARATEVLSDGITARPDEPALLRALAEVRLADRDLPAAARFAQRAIDANPGAAEPHELLARIQFESGEWSAAEAAARRALEIDQARFAANLFLGLAIDRQPQRRQEAFQQFQNTRRRHPDRWEPYYYIGALLGSARQFEDAFRFANRALALAPGNPQVEDLLQLLQEQSTLPEGEARR